MAEHVIERLDNAQIANARMNDMHEVWEHAQLKARKRWVEVDTAVAVDGKTVDRPVILKAREILSGAERKPGK